MTTDEPQGTSNFDESSALPITSRKWFWLRYAFAMLVSVTISLLCWALFEYVDHERSHMMAVGIGVVVLLLNALAFQLSHIVAVRRLVFLQSELENIRRTDRLPPLRRSGWSQTDQLRQTFIRILREREQKIFELTQARDYFHRIAESTSGIEAYFDNQAQLSWINAGVLEKAGIQAQECLDHKDFIGMFLPPEDQEEFKKRLRHALHGEEIEEAEQRIRHQSGRYIWFYYRLSAVRDEYGAVLGAHFSAKNIQSRKEAEQKLIETVSALRATQEAGEQSLVSSNQERTKLEALLDNVSLGILFVNSARSVIYINQVAIDMWRLQEKREKLLGMYSPSLMEQISPMLADSTEFFSHIETFSLSELPRSEPHDTVLRDGRVLRDVCTNLLSEDKTRTCGRLWIFEDVTETHQHAKALTELSTTDPLTGLHNRRHYNAELNRLLTDMPRTQTSVGLICIDLDGFKSVNHSFSHHAGDKVLIELCADLQSLVRGNEQLFRLGGDEFAVVVEHADLEKLRLLAARIGAKINERPFFFGQTKLVMSASIGIALAPLHAKTADQLQVVADQALYEAKAKGKNRFETAHKPNNNLSY